MKVLSFWLLWRFLLITIMAVVFFYYLILYRPVTQSPCEVYVYTYSSFVSPVGVGGDIKTLFKQETGCVLHLENIGDARMLLQRLDSEMKIRNKVDADVVLGLDQFSVEQAYKILKWQEIPWSDQIAFSHRLNRVHLSRMTPFNVFIPVDWSPLTFIYRADQSQTNVFKMPQDILTSSKKYSLMDPRSSSPGFQFLVWIIHQFGEEILHQFIQKAYLISPSWTTAYGLFTKRQTDIAFSYLTSLAYHWVEEESTEFQVMQFKLGHPYQIEFAGVVADSPRIQTALRFLKFLHSPQVQKLIMTKNYMFPVIQDVEDQTAFARLPKLPLVENHTLRKSEKDYLQHWKQFQRDAFSQNASAH